MKVNTQAIAEASPALVFHCRGILRAVSQIGLPLLLAVSITYIKPWSNWTKNRAEFRANPSFVA